MHIATRLCVLLALIAPFASAAPGDLSLAGAVPPQVKSSGPARHLMLADLDGDGHVDVVRSSDVVEIWRQVEGGRLTPFTSLAGGGAAAVADLDDDGLLSIVVVNTSDVQAAEFTAPWTLGPELQLTATGDGGSSNFAAAADLDGDGHPDVLSTNLAGSQLRFWHGDGSGGLLPSVIAANVGTVWTELADFDLDGQLDLLAAIGSTAVPLLGTGDGHFVAQAPIPLASPAADVALGQLDGDGTIDAAIACVLSVQLLLGDGHGSFVPWLGAGTGSPGRTVDLHDVDGDGDDDLLSTTFSSLTVQQMTPAGLADGEVFPTSFPITTRDAIYIPLDGDAPLSLLITAGDPTIGESLVIWNCDDQGRPVVETPLADGTQALAVADVDGDGQDELVAWEQAASQIVVREIPGDGTLGPPSAGTRLNSPIAPTTRVLDLDGDALQDLLVTTPTGWLPLRSKGDGTFTPGPSIPANASNYEQGLGDLDGDGDLDFLIARGQVSAFVVEWYANLGDGSFGPAQSGSIPGYELSPFVLGDTDEDGLDDLVTGSQDQVGLVRQWKGSGHGQFAAPVVLASGPHGTEGLSVVDLDGDGHLDVVAAGDTTELIGESYDFYGELTVLHGHGDGRFEPAQRYHDGAAFSSRPPWTVDFDGDGRRDILVFDEGSGRSNLMLQAADGSFGEAQPLPVVLNVEQPEPCAADVNGDGVKDLLDVSPGGFGALRVAYVHAKDGPIDLGHGKAGSTGLPVLTGGGTLQPTQAASLKLHAAPANTPLLLVLGLQTSYTQVGPQSFLEPQLVPEPQLVLGGLMSDAFGTFALKSRWPADAPPGLPIFVQVWCKDPVTGQLVASNALQYQGD